MYIFKEIFLARSREHESVIWSSFFYLVSAAIIGNTHIVITSFLFLVFLTSVFYHSHPENIYFRIADWLSSIFFLFYIVEYIIEIDFYNSVLLSLFLLLAALALVSLLVSFFAEYLKVRYLYNASHIIWHLTSCLGICFILFAI